MSHGVGQQGLLCSRRNRCITKHTLCFFFSQMDESSFTMTFFGQGYSHGFSIEKNKPNIKICTQVKGPGIVRMA